MEGSGTFVAECFWPAVRGPHLETDEQRQKARSGRGR
jgi:hypothetical protein